MNTLTVGNTARVYSTRAETEPCEANTVGCAIDHSVDAGGCEGW